MKWKVLTSEYLANYNYFTARKDKCQTPEGKIIESYYVVELPLTVCALAITEDGDAIMVKQYRYPVDQVIIELPGGFLDKGESAEVAVARELLEETGYTFNAFIPLGQVYANPGVLNNLTMLYLATGGKKVTEQKLDFNEDIEIMLVPLDQLEEMVLQNKIPQALHTTCILYGLLKLNGALIQK